MHFMVNRYASCYGGEELLQAWATSRRAVQTGSRAKTVLEFFTCLIHAAVIKHRWKYF